MKKIINEEKRQLLLKELNVIKKIISESIQVPNNIQQIIKPINGDKIIEDDMVNVPNNNFNKEIENIRKLSIETVAKLANDPTNPLYEFFKKIWSMCDKQQLDNKNIKNDKIDSVI